MKFSDMSAPDSQALVLTDHAIRRFGYTETALVRKHFALAGAEIVKSIETANDQQLAVTVQKVLAELINQAKEEVKAAKAPAKSFIAFIDDVSGKFLSELEHERDRLTRLVGDFQALEEARVRAEKQIQNDKLLALERERAAEIALAKSHDELDSIQAKYAEKAALEANSAPAQAIREPGQIVRQDWEILISDIHLLYRAHPVCVKLTALTGEIKSLLDAGVKVAGVTATKITKAGVRVKSQPKAIEA